MEEVPRHDIQSREVPKVVDKWFIHHIEEAGDMEGREKPENSGLRFASSAMFRRKKHLTRGVRPRILVSVISTGRRKGAIYSHSDCQTIIERLVIVFQEQ